MCIGPLAPKLPSPVQPRPTTPAPTVKAAAPPSEMVTPEKIKDVSEEDKIETKKKKALEIKKVKEGVKEFGAIDPKAMPKSPEGGINTGGL